MIQFQTWQNLLKEAKVVGIPDRSDFGNVSDLPLNKLLTYVVQKHYAKRAGPHFDVRLGDKELHSWASKKGLPEPGQRHLFIHQPIHHKEYAHFEGDIKKGYGAGKVVTHDKGTAVVTKVTPKKINFALLHKKFPEFYTLVNTEDKNWLAINTTPTNPYKFLGNREGFEKPKMKSVGEADIKELAKTHLISAKLSGASNLFKLNKDSVDVLSYRISKAGRPIIHTQRFFGLKKHKIEIPKHLVGTVLRGEVYGMKGDKPISEQQLGGLLNASVLKSLHKQEHQGIDLKAAIFDIVGYRGNPDDRRTTIQKILKHLPGNKFVEPPYADSPKSAVKLIQDIKAGKYPLTSEGFVGWPLSGGPAVKGKNFEEADVYVKGFSEGLGRLRGKGVGAIKYSLTPRGSIVGEVASGLSDETRRMLRDNKEDYLGRVINIKHRGQGSSGAYFQPTFLAFHESPRVKRAFWQSFINTAKTLELGQV